MVEHISRLKLHQGEPVQTAGVPLDEAQAAVIMLHGRGGVAQDILNVAAYFKQPGVAYLAPQAAGNSWYPNSFLAPLESNEPWLTSALVTVNDALAEIAATGVPPRRTVLLGFSQGACLALEFAARNARRYGGVIALSGGLIGPDDAPRHYAGTLNRTPVFLGCSDVDAFIPVEHIHYSADVMAVLDATVTKRIYPGMGHIINQDEIDFVKALLATLATP